MKSLHSLVTTKMYKKKLSVHGSSVLAVKLQIKLTSLYYKGNKLSLLENVCIVYFSFISTINRLALG